MKTEYMAHMGSDLLVVNAARVSFGKEVKELGKSDEGLIRFLATGLQSKEKDAILQKIKDEWPVKNEELMALVDLLSPDKHFMPFCHPHVTFRCSAPIFVVRQLMKHQIGFSWSEESLRYIQSECEMYYPEFYRAAAADKKQGSSHEHHPGSDEILKLQKAHDAQVIEFYKTLIKDGVCPEQARALLPLNTYVNWVWTGSLYAWSRMANLRLNPHAQKETQDFAKLIDPKMKELFPLSWKHLMRSSNVRTVTK